jgi:hypothetical protein
MFKAQSTLDSFFGITKKDDSNRPPLKKYFYLKWTNKFTPECNAYWTDERPQEINFIEQIKCPQIQKEYYFYICGYFPDYEEKKFNLGKEKYYKNPGFLKSHLQKNIRKQDDMLAIPTCYHFLKLNQNECIRRLSIIMLEDVELHECLTTIIWLTVALSKDNFRIKKYMYEWILGSIYVLCKMDKKDNIDEYKEEITAKFESDEIRKLLADCSSLSTEQISILYSMIIRISYGGMEGDLKMIKNFIYTWKNRFLTEKKEPNKTIVRPISIYVNELKTAEWDLSAIDYHCCHKIIDFILKKYPEFTPNEIKELIWTYSSSINTRRINKIEDNISAEKWNKIKDYVNKTQKYILESS